MSNILLVIYDNGSYIHWFPQGMAYLASYLLRDGHKVKIYNQDINHYPDSYLTEYLNQNHFDFVLVGACGGYYQYRKLLSISKAINDSEDRPVYILGGHIAAPEPEYFLRKTGADFVVIGEGEETVSELVDCIWNNHNNLNEIKGIAYLDVDYSLMKTPKRELIKDVDSILYPAWHLFDINYYRLLRMPNCSKEDFIMPVLSGRGCPFKCTFCYRMDEGFRPRSAQSIIDEIMFLKNIYGITYIAFSDELLMSSEQRTTELCNAFIEQDINVKWDCNGRLNYAKPKLLKLMKKAGCVFINYGVESFDNNVLRNMKKNLNTEQIETGINNTIKASISPGINILFGNIGDDEDTLTKGVQFLLKYDDGAQLRTIRPVCPYPGCELYYYAIKKGLLKDIENFYEKKHINSDLLTVNFTDMSDEEFNNELFKANSILINNYFKNKCKATLNEAKELYTDNNRNFRGFRQT